MLCCVLRGDLLFWVVLRVVCGVVNCIALYVLRCSVLCVVPFCCVALRYVVLWCGLLRCAVLCYLRVFVGFGGVVRVACCCVVLRCVVLCCVWCCALLCCVELRVCWHVFVCCVYVVFSVVGVVLCLVVLGSVVLGCVVSC